VHNDSALEFSRQVETVTERLGAGEIDKLLTAGDTWQVE
jgi:hypothetical protein